jgi:hypothetical protein
MSITVCPWRVHHHRHGTGLLAAGALGGAVPELSDLTYEKSMGSARFMKSIRARHEDGVVLVKVVVKPYVMKLDKYRKRIIGKFFGRLTRVYGIVTNWGL